MQAYLKSRVSSVDQGLDFSGRLVMVETGATELGRGTSTELTSLLKLSTGFVTVAKEVRTPGTLSLSVAMIARLI